MRRLALLGVAGLLLSSAGPRPVSAQPAPPKYTITDLGHLGGEEARATAISARGQIVGVSYLPGRTVRHAFLYENGAMTDLCTSLPSGTWWPDWYAGVAGGINGRGQVVG